MKLAPLEATARFCVGGEEPAALVKLSVVGVSTGATVCAVNCAQVAAASNRANCGRRKAHAGDV